MLKKVIGIGLVLALGCKASFASSVDEEAGVSVPLEETSSLLAVEEDDFLLLTVPAVAGVVNREPPPPIVVNPRWSVVTEVCCSTSSATFQVIQGSDKRASTSPSCSVAAAQSSEVESTAGSKAFSFSIDSAGCGRVANGFNFSFEEKTRYLFAAQFENGGININVYSGAINSNPRLDNVDISGEQGLSFEQTFRLSNIRKGESSFESIANDIKR